MTTPIKVVVVGAGYFAGFHIDAWFRLDNVKLQAIVEQDTSKHDSLRDMLRAHGTEQGAETTLVTDSMSVALQNKPDLIDIATPPHSHAALIEQAIANDCALVACQKPFCGNLQAASQVFNKIKHSRSAVAVHENFRFQPWYRAIKTELENDTIGQVLNTTFRLRPGDGQGKEAYLERQPYFRDMQQFLIHETGIHYIDVFRYLFGEPDAVSAELHRLNPAIAGEDAGHFIFYYNNGLRAHFDGNRLLDHAADNTRLTMGEMLIEGTQGSMTLHGNGELLQRKFDQSDWQPVIYTFEDNNFGGDCVYLLQKHLRDHLLHGTALENSVTDYMQNLNLEELVYKAAKTHTQLETGS